MITVCQICSTKDQPKKTRHIDASVYAGDYRSPPSPKDYAPGRQCTECGAVSEVHRVGKKIKVTYKYKHNLPPRKQWTDPKL